MDVLDDVMLFVIPEYGNRELTVKCVNSIQASLPSAMNVQDTSIWIGNDAYPGSPYTNAREQGKEFTQLYDESIIHEKTWKENLGFTGNVNRTVELAIESTNPAPDTTLFIVNSDIIFRPDAIECLDYQASRARRSLVGPAILVSERFVNHPRRHHQLFNKKLLKAKRGGKENGYPIEEPIFVVSALSGSCLAVPVFLWKELGGFDAKTFPHYWSDDDLCLRARQKGFMSFVDLYAVVAHQINQSYQKRKDWRKLIRAGNLAFKNKYPDIAWNHTGNYDLSKFLRR